MGQRVAMGRGRSVHPQRGNWNQDWEVREEAAEELRRDGCAGTSKSSMSCGWNRINETECRGNTGRWQKRVGAVGSLGWWSGTWEH